jgi:hypothetical protein
MRSHREWLNYLEIDPYPISPRKVHVGNHVRRDLLFVPKGTGSPDGSRSALFASSLSLAGWRTPSAQVAAGHPWTVEVYLRRTGNKGTARPVAFLAGQGRVWAIDVPPAYDQVPITAWNRDEEAKVWLNIPVPADASPGTYALGFLWLGPEGAFPPAVPAPAPVYHQHEVRWDGVVEVVSEARAVDLVRRAAEGQGDCDLQSQVWRDGRHALGPTHPARQEAQRAVNLRLGRCFAAKVASGDDTQRSEWVRQGRLANRFARYDPTVRATLDLVAARWRARSREAESAGDLEAAWSWSTASLVLDPSQAWERRRAERLRNQRLKLDIEPALSDRLREVLGW